MILIRAGDHVARYDQAALDVDRRQRRVVRRESALLVRRLTRLRIGQRDSFRLLLVRLFRAIQLRQSGLDLFQTTPDLLLRLLDIFRRLAFLCGERLVVDGIFGRRFRFELVVLLRQLLPHLLEIGPRPRPAPTVVRPNPRPVRSVSTLRVSISSEHGPFFKQIILVVVTGDFAQYIGSIDFG